MPTCEPIIYQLKVVLRGISPMIWRRLLICGDSTIADRHYIVQIAMGWSDDHLHQFRIHGKRYGIDRMGGISFSDDPKSVKLKDLGLRINERFVGVLATSVQKVTIAYCTPYRSCRYCWPEVSYCSIDTFRRCV